jgi:hypothetical protein
MKIAFLIALLVTISLIAQAQSIKGKLVDPADNKPLIGATLKLTAVKDSTVKFNTISDNKGFFEFKGLPVDSFQLQITFSGYEPFKQIVVSKETDVDMGLVSMPKTIKQMGEVVVVINTPPTTQKGDTTQFNASQFKVNPDATTEDLIKKMPGITVAKDGTVTAQGEQVKKVTVDGRDFFGDDATAALRNLPSTIVDKIQVFDRLSDQAQFTGFDDGSSVKAINIITKSGIKNGQFGRIFAGYGTDDRYSAGGNVSFFKGDRRISLVGNFNNVNLQNFASQDLLGVTSSGGRGFGGFGGGNFGGGNRGGGRGGSNFGGFGGGDFTVGQQSGISKTNSFGINFSDKWSKKLDVTGSYFFNNSNISNDQTIKSQTLFSGKTQYSDQNSVSSSKNYNHRINMRLEYKIDSSNSFIISPSLNFQNNKSVSSGMSQTYYGIGDTLNTADNNSINNRDGYNIRNNILFRHSFAAKRGRTLSVNLNTTFNKNDGESYTISHYRFFNQSIATDSLQDQYTLNPTNGYSINSNISYTEPIGKKGQLQISYSPSYSKSKADQQTYTYDQIGGKYSKFDTTLSNRFNNTTTTHNSGITYRLGQSRDNQFSVGLSFQYSKLQSDRVFPTATQVNQTFTTLLPNLMWRKKISAHSNFNLFYRENTNFPSVTQLQDVVNITNPLRVSSGNPSLKQSTTHFVSGRYTFTNTRKGTSFFANVFLQAAQNYISTATYSPVSDSAIQQGIILKAGSQLTKPVNMDGYKSLRSFFTYSMPVKFIKSNINVSTGFIYSRLPGLINYQKTVTNNYAFNNGVVIASNINEYVDFNLSYNVSFNNAKSSVQGQSDKYVNQSAGLQFNLLSKSGWFVQNDISNQTYTGLSQGLNQSYWLWNAAIGKKFLKNNVGELKLSVFDLLKQNQSIVRTVSENYIEDSQTKVLSQYFMLTFTYSLKNFGTPKSNNNFQQRREWGPPRF